MMRPQASWRAGSGSGKGLALVGGSTMLRTAIATIEEDDAERGGGPSRGPSMFGPFGLRTQSRGGGGAAGGEGGAAEVSWWAAAWDGIATWFGGGRDRDHSSPNPFAIGTATASSLQLNGVSPSPNVPSHSLSPLSSFILLFVSPFPSPVRSVSEAILARDLDEAAAAAAANKGLGGGGDDPEAESDRRALLAGPMSRGGGGGGPLEDDTEEDSGPLLRGRGGSYSAQVQGAKGGGGGKSSCCGCCAIM